MNVKIVTDSTSYIPQNLKKEYDISIASLNVTFGTESVKEIDLDNNYFYNRMEETNIIPTSSQPSVEELLQIFEGIVSKGDAVVGVFISSDMSGTYSTSQLVKNLILEKYSEAKIELVDSRSNSMQLGYAALAAAKVAKAGGSVEDAVEAAKENIKRSRYIFIPNTLEYLKKGGRIGGASALIGSLFHITPILTVYHGKTSVYKKVRGKKNALETMMEVIKQDVNTYGLGEVLVHHINIREEAEKFANKIEEALNIKVIICDLGPVIGLHVGPGAIGLVYYTNQPILEMQ